MLKLDEMEKARVNLIDVRTPDEFNAGSVPNAINVPLNEVVNRLDELKELQPMLVFLCCWCPFTKSDRLFNSKWC